MFRARRRSKAFCARGQACRRCTYVGVLVVMVAEAQIVFFQTTRRSATEVEGGRRGGGEIFPYGKRRRPRPPGAEKYEGHRARRQRRLGFWVLGFGFLGRECLGDAPDGGCQARNMPRAWFARDAMRSIDLCSLALSLLAWTCDRERGSLGMTRSEEKMEHERVISDLPLFACSRRSA